MLKLLIILLVNAPNTLLKYGSSFVWRFAIKDYMTAIQSSNMQSAKLEGELAAPTWYCKFVLRLSLVYWLLVFY